jgi:hypothetical protein
MGTVLVGRRWSLQSHYWPVQASASSSNESPTPSVLAIVPQQSRWVTNQVSVPAAGSSAPVSGVLVPGMLFCPAGQLVSVQAGGSGTGAAASASATGSGGVLQPSELLYGIQGVGVPAGSAVAGSITYVTPTAAVAPTRQQQEVRVVRIG